MKEESLPKIENIGQLTSAIFLMKLTRHSMVGYITGLDRSRDDGAENVVSHIYKGEFGGTLVGMCKRAYNKNGGFSIWRNNITKGVCKVCLKNTLKDISPLPPQDKEEKI